MFARRLTGERGGGGESEKVRYRRVGEGFAEVKVAG